MFYGEIVTLHSQDAEAAKAVKNNSAIGRDNIPMVFPTVYVPFPKHVQCPELIAFRVQIHDDSRSRNSPGYI
jgi:hypothetical protein